LSLYSTPISKIAFTDLQELLSDQSVENVRLEFKRDVPGKDESLKKLSSFANTYGGYAVIGAEAGNDGRITNLCGVAMQPGYKQTIIQWCTAGMNPPLSPEVSDPIPLDPNNARVCYVIYVPESEFAPHFLNGRRGLYVRTDEFSSRFEARLANEMELRYLLDRRQLVLDRRAALFQRSRERFSTFFKRVPPSEAYGDAKPLPVFLSLSIIPRYPVQPVVGHERLLSIIQETSVPWRGGSYPQDRELISQHESALMLGPAGPWSLLESNVWGMLSYSAAIGEDMEGRYSGVHTAQFIGFVLVFLEHARELIRILGVSTPLHVEVLLTGIRGVPWLRFYYGMAQPGPSSELDNEVAFTLDSTTEYLMQSRDQMAGEILRVVFLAINWPKTADNPQKLLDLLKAGYEYNNWRLG
jgi:hypothetical protein